MDATRSIRVLLIAPIAVPTPVWRRSATRFDVTRAGDLREAAAVLASKHIDAAVLEAGISEDPAASLRELIDDYPETAALVLSSDTADSDAAFPIIHMPTDASPEQQADLLLLSVERTRLKRASERSEARFRAVIERNADALMVIDETGSILFANRMAAELFDQPRDRLVGSAFGFPAIAGETTELDMRDGEHTRVVEMRVVESEWEGRSACIASLRDITHRKQAEEIARGLIREQAARSVAETAARRFRFLAESSTVLASTLDFDTTLKELARLCVSEIAEWAVVYILDDAGGVRRLEVAHRNDSKHELAAELRGSSEPLAEPHPVLDVLRTRLPILKRDVDEPLLQSLSSNPHHVELIRSLGVASFMVVPLIVRDRSLGAMALVVGEGHTPFGDDDLELAEDLALRAALAVDNARLYRTAQEMSQTKSDLFASISHDLRTPLNSIMGHADLLSMGIPETLGEGSLRHVERINKSAVHLLHLIDELLTLVRLEAGREELALVDVAVGDIVNDVTDVVELLARERGLEFSTSMREPGLVLRTDPSRLRQVLLNLIGNAIRYTEQGSIRLETRADGEMVRLSVIDTGVGIAAEDLERMFEPFWQADTARRIGDGGTGLGLSVVHRLVALLGGRIQVQSELGAGSTFMVILPVRHPGNNTVPA